MTAFRRVLFALSVLATIDQPQFPTYRATADAVTVDVSVLRGNRPVEGLGVQDFALWDNDERQLLTTVAVETAPLEIALLIDVSQSLDDPRIAARSRIEQAVEQVSGLIRPEDRLRLLPVDSRIREVSPTAEVAPSDRPEERQTALLDALVVLAMQPISDRRRLAIALTDGIDTVSSVTERLRAAVLDKSDVVIHVVAIARYRNRGLFAPFGNLTDDPFMPYSWALQDVVHRTGGRFFDVRLPDDFVPRLQAAVDEFRVRYILRYTPSDPQPGWHRIRVNVLNRGNYNIRHRRGYWLPTKTLMP